MWLRFWDTVRGYAVTKYSNFLTRWSVSSQSQAKILSRETRCDTVAMFLLRNIMEMLNREQFGNFSPCIVRMPSSTKLSEIFWR